MSRLVVCLCLIIVACTGEPGPQIGAPPVDPPDAPAADDWDGTLYDPPEVTERAELDDLASALATGAVDPGRARLAMWRHILGQPDDLAVPPAPPSSVETPEVPLDLTLADSIARLGEMEPADAEALLDLLAPFLLETGDIDTTDWSVDLTELDWCIWGRGDGQRVSLRVQTRPPCERDDEGLMIRDDAGVPNPPHCHPGLIEAPWTADCDSLPDGVVLPTTAALAEAALGAIEVSNSTFRAGLQTGDEDVEKVRTYILDSSPSHWQGGYLYGLAQSTLSDDWCRVIVTATPPGPSPTADSTTVGEVERVSDVDTVRGTLAHEVFHCHQAFAGLDAIPSQAWALESTAAWAEDVIGDEYWPGVDTEHLYGHRFIDTPGKTFECRAYDAVYAMLHVHDEAQPFWVYDWLMSSQNSQLDDMLPLAINNFAETWHDVSLGTWNQAPVPVYINDARPFVGSSSEVYPSETITPETEWAAPSLDLPPLSYMVQVFEPEEDVNRVVFVLPDPASIPDVEVSLVVEGGTNPGVTRLTGEQEVEVCLRAVGPCHLVEPQDLEDGERFGLVWTNTHIDDSQDVGAGWESYAPRLHGTWLTTSSSSSLPSDASLQTGGILTIDEELVPDTFSEDLNGVSTGATGETCQTSGTPGGAVVSSYDVVDELTASGTLAVNSITSGASYTCTSTGPGGLEVERSGNTFGVWLVGNEASPWAPMAWSLDGETLSLSTTSGPATWSLTLVRQ